MLVDAEGGQLVFRHKREATNRRQRRGGRRERRLMSTDEGRRNDLDTGFA